MPNAAFARVIIVNGNLRTDRGRWLMGDWAAAQGARTRSLGTDPSTLGWPLLAVIPDRDFLYLWAAQHRDFVHRIGGVAVREFTNSPYPLTTEVFEIGDAGIVASGAFPVVGTGAAPGPAR